MSYFSPDVILLILGPWIGIFYYSVDLWWVSDPVWSNSLRGYLMVVDPSGVYKNQSCILSIRTNVNWKGSRLVYRKFVRDWQKTVWY